MMVLKELHASKIPSNPLLSPMQLQNQSESVISASISKRSKYNDQSSSRNK